MLSDWLAVAIFIIIIIVLKSSFPEPHSQLYKKDMGLEPPSRNLGQRALPAGPAHSSVPYDFVPST